MLQIGLKEWKISPTRRSRIIQNKYLESKQLSSHGQNCWSWSGYWVSKTKISTSPPGKFNMTRNSMIDSDKTKEKNPKPNTTPPPPPQQTNKKPHLEAKLAVDGCILIKTRSKKALISVTAFENTEWCSANSHSLDFPLPMVNARDVVCLPLLV